MEQPPKRLHALSERHLFMALLCVPLAYGVVYFLRLCHEEKSNPEKFLDSPGSFGVGIIFSAIFVLPALLGIIVLLFRRQRDAMRK